MTILFFSLYYYYYFFFFFFDFQHLVRILRSLQYLGLSRANCLKKYFVITAKQAECSKQVTKRGRKSTCIIHLPSKFAEDTADPNNRCCLSKVILFIFEHQPENIVLKTIPQPDFPGKTLDGYIFSHKGHASIIV